MLFPIPTQGAAGYTWITKPGDYHSVEFLQDLRLTWQIGHVVDYSPPDTLRLTGYTVPNSKNCYVSAYNELYFASTPLDWRKDIATPFQFYVDYTINIPVVLEFNLKLDFLDNVNLFADNELDYYCIALRLTFSNTESFIFTHSHTFIVKVFAVSLSPQEEASQAVETGKFILPINFEFIISSIIIISLIKKKSKENKT